MRIDAAGDDEASVGCQVGTDDGGVRRTVVVDADERFDDAAGLDLVVILANDPFFAGNVEGSENLPEVVSVVRLIVAITLRVMSLEVCV